MAEDRYSSLEAAFVCEDCGHQVGPHLWPNLKCRQCRGEQLHVGHQAPIKITARRRYRERTKATV
jgi:hypothetical protein